MFNAAALLLLSVAPGKAVEVDAGSDEGAIVEVLGGKADASAFLTASVAAFSTGFESIVVVAGGLTVASPNNEAGAPGRPPKKGDAAGLAAKSASKAAGASGFEPPNKGAAAVIGAGVGVEAGMRRAGIEVCPKAAPNDDDEEVDVAGAEKEYVARDCGAKEMVLRVAAIVGRDEESIPGAMTTEVEEATDLVAEGFSASHSSQ